jgi:hypothetical protein
MRSIKEINNEIVISNRWYLINRCNDLSYIWLLQVYKYDSEIERVYHKGDVYVIDRNGLIIRTHKTDMISEDGVRYGIWGDLDNDFNVVKVKLYELNGILLKNQINRLE